MKVVRGVYSAAVTHMTAIDKNPIGDQFHIAPQLQWLAVKVVTFSSNPEIDAISNSGLNGPTYGFSIGNCDDGVLRALFD